MDDITEPGQSTAEMNRIPVCFEDAVNMSDEELKNKKEIVIKLEDTHKIASSISHNNDLISALDRVMTFAQDATLVIDCGDATEIESYDLEFLYYSAITSIKKVKVIGPRVKKIGSNFLFGSESLISVDLSGLSNVTWIGIHFLSNCKSLTSVDLRPLSKVTKIGDYFLFECSSLTSIDLSGLSNLTQIGGAFLHSCSRLTSVDLTPLSNVTKIGHEFLSYCESLTSIDLSGLSNLTQIGDEFLSYCESLTSVTVPQDWRFKMQLISGLPQNVDIIENVPTEGPRRPGSDYTTSEYNQASILMQGVREIDQSSAAYLAKLETVFSHDRAFKILEDMQNGDVHSSDSD